MTDRERGFLGIEGVVHPIVQVGDPVLSTKCEPVAVFGEDLHKLIADMYASMYAADGVGLAANQIGVGLRVFVYDCPDAEQQYHRGVVVNPSLVPPVERHLDEDQEGCLSVRGQFTDLARPDFATVTGFDHIGAPIKVSGDGLLARCLQHEYDHLEGMLYIDRLSARARKKVLKAYAEEHQAL
ncbi:MAG: peptide deformylase [Actinobacteria bacterium]|jgi:peptide deformylase|nr:peptide deformylase [Actinomycetota bacterium]MCB9427827.1 peptide deformylase [Actinomycetota bacterium]MCO5299415.1 peptide deformylase [Candidatus Nanopelagicales bacterium]HPJ19146.1 peptide deformylase [Actinomycetota bacterium]HPQ85161.1 peptide deformylase [Actinomycetota bacterium]